MLDNSRDVTIPGDVRMLVVSLRTWQRIVGAGELSTLYVSGTPSTVEGPISARRRAYDRSEATAGPLVAVLEEDQRMIRQPVGFKERNTAVVGGLLLLLLLLQIQDSCGGPSGGGNAPPESQPTAITTAVPTE